MQRSRIRFNRRARPSNDARLERIGKDKARLWNFCPLVGFNLPTRRPGRKTGTRANEPKPQRISAFDHTISLRHIGMKLTK